MNELLESIMSATKAGVKVEFFKDSDIKNSLVVNIIKKVNGTTYGMANIFANDHLEYSPLNPVKDFIDESAKTLKTK